MKKTAAILLTLLLLVNTLAVTSFADSTNSYGTQNAQSFSFITDNLKTYLLGKIKNCDTTIDVSSYNIPASSANNLLEYISHYLPETFNILVKSAQSEMKTYEENNYIKTITLSYNCTKSEYNSMLRQFSTKVSSLLSGIKDSTLTDYQKALLIHDRLINNCYYTKTATTHCYDAYGAIVEGKAVCQGYTLAYMYLLNQVGIDNYFCTSDILNHSWNIVKINNKYYHVDTTFDDPTNSILGTVNHDNFLLSSNAFANLHLARDYDMTLTDTTFDNYFWKSSTAEFQVVNNSIYYIDGSTGNLNKWNLDSDDQTLTTVSEHWTVSENSYYPGCHSKLSSDGKNLFFSSKDKILKYDLTYNSIVTAYTPTLSGYSWIYGFIYKDNKFYYVVYNKPFIAENETVTISTYSYTDHTYTIDTKKLSYLKDGNVYTTFSDIVYYNGKTYLVKNGIVDNSQNAVVELNNKFYHVKNGCVAVNEGATLLNYNGGLVYFENGVALNKTLILDYNGKRYCIVDGNVSTIDTDAIRIFTLNGHSYFISRNGSLCETDYDNLDAGQGRILHSVKGIITHSVKYSNKPAELISSLIDILIGKTNIDYLYDFSRDEQLDILDLVSAKKELASK